MDAGTFAMTDGYQNRFCMTAVQESVRVNVLSPGHVDTPILESLQQDDALTKMKKEMENNVPLGGLQEPDEIAKAVSFLASVEASSVSGTELTSMAVHP